MCFSVCNELKQYLFKKYKASEISCVLQVNRLMKTKVSLLVYHPGRRESETDGRFQTEEEEKQSTKIFNYIG